MIERENDEVVIRKSEDMWAAFDAGKRIGSSKCRNCLVKMLLNITKNSSRYKVISVYDDINELTATYRTGAGNARRD